MTTRRRPAWERVALAAVLLAGCDRHDAYDANVDAHARGLFDARLRQVFADPNARRVTFRTSPSDLEADAALAAIFRRLGYFLPGKALAFSRAALAISKSCGRYEPAGCRVFPVADDEFADAYAFRRGPKTWHMTDEVRVRVHVRERPVGALGAAIAAAGLFECPRDGALEPWTGEPAVSDSTVWLAFRHFSLDRTIDDVAADAATAAARVTKACPATKLDAGGNALIQIDEYGGEYE